MRSLRALTLLGLGLAFATPAHYTWESDDCYGY